MSRCVFFPLRGNRFSFSFGVEIAVKCKFVQLYSLGCQDEFPPSVDVGRIGVLATQELGHLSSGKFRFADVAEIPGKVNRLA